MQTSAVFHDTFDSLSTVARRLGLLRPACDTVPHAVHRTVPAGRLRRSIEAMLRSPLERETDPHAVAASVAVAMVQAAGPIAQDGEAALCMEFEALFGMRDARGLLDRGRRLAKGYRDPAAVCDRAAGCLKSQFWHRQRCEFFGMLTRLSGRVPEQRHALNRLKQRLEI